MAVIVWCCTACFDLQENLFLKKDGSGTFSFIVNAEQIKSMMGMFDGMGNTSTDTSATNGKTLNKLEVAFEKTKNRLQSIEGISNITAIGDTIKYEFGISFDFANISALNIGLNRLFEEDTSSNRPIINYFEYSNNELKRLEVVDSKSYLGKSIGLQNDTTSFNAHKIFDFEKFFGAVSYTTNYEFEEKVESFQNKKATLSSNTKKVTLVSFPFANTKDSTEKKTNIANVIYLK